MSIALLSIDPGVRSAGVAAWSLSKTLIKALRFEVDLSEPFSLVAEIRTEFPGIQAVAIERPRLIGGRSLRGDANDLLDLAQSVGELRYGLSEGGAIPTYLYTPQQWKGQTPKDVTKNRCKVILSIEEQKRIVIPGDKKKETEVWDGIGLGLHHLGR